MTLKTQLISYELQALIRFARAAHLRGMTRRQFIASRPEAASKLHRAWDIANVQ